MNPDFPYDARVAQSIYDKRNHSIPPLSQMQNPESSDQSNGRRSRVSRACDVCRRKKIRCDVDVNNPCTTCAQSNWECTFHEQVRKRGPPKGYIGSLESRLQKMERLLETLSGGAGRRPDLLDDDDDEEEERQKRQKHSHSPISVQLSPPTSQRKASSTKEPIRTAKSPKSAEESNLKNRVSAMEPKIARYIGSSSGLYLMSRTRDEDTMRRSLLFKDELGTYRFGAASDISDDMMLLRDQSTIDRASDGDDEQVENTISRDILVCLIETYFAKAHQFMPVIDKKSFMESFERTEGGAPISKALLYSLCAVGCRLIPGSDKIFQRHKIAKDDLLSILMDKATEAVSRNYLNTKIEIIQALVLLASQPNFASNSYTAWMYSGMAVRMAQDMGLHRSIPKWKMADYEAEQRKRIWFSVYTVDRWCCAAVGRPLAISEADCDIELPQLYNDENMDDSTHWFRQLFRNMISLSAILGYVLRQLYSPKVKAMGLTSPDVASVVFNLESQLKDWYDQLPVQCKLLESDLDRLKQAKTVPLDADLKEKIETAGILTICHQTVIILLNRPFITTSKEVAINSKLLKAANNCTNAARIIIDVAYALTVGACSACFEWVFPTYSIYQATLIHLFDCASDSQEVARKAREYVRVSLDDCLKPVFDSLPHGWRMLTFIRNVLESIPTYEERLGTEAIPNKGKPLDGPTQQPNNAGNLQGDDNSLHPETLQQIFSSFSESVPTPDPSAFPSGSYPSSLGYPGGQIPDPNSAAPFWGASSAFGFDWQDWDTIFIPQTSNNSGSSNNQINNASTLLS